LELVDVVQDNQSDDILLKINEEGDAANVMATTVFEDDDQQEVGSEAQSGHQTGA